jgi:hypothetical protein
MSSSFLSGRIALAARLALPLFDPPGQNCLASELASLFERSSVSLANRTFPPLRPPNLHVSKRHDVWILAIGRFNHPPDTHLLKIQDLLGSFRNSTRPQIDSEVRIAVRLAGRHRTARSAPQATGSHDADFADSKMPPLSSVFYGWLRRLIFLGRRT